MPACVNHPYQEAQQPCPDCGLPFCSACLVEFLGQRICGPCRDRRLAQMQGGAVPLDAPLAGTGTVDIGGWVSAGWTIVKDDLLTFALAILVGGFIGFFTCGIAAPAMSAGILMMAYRKMTTGYVEFGNLFDGFRRFGNALLLALLLVLIEVGLSLVFIVPYFVAYFTTGENSGTTLLAKAVLNIGSSIVGLIVGGASLFALPHVAARNVAPMEAVRASFEVFRRNPWAFLVVPLLWRLITLAGVFACCIGIFVTTPLVLAATAKAYADHFGLQGWESV